MPTRLTLAAVTQGMAFALWPFSWVVSSAVPFYNLSGAGGDFEVIRRSLLRLTTEPRLLALLVAFGFGALVERIAGFGAPVAITASMLVGLGFESVSPAVLAHVANTAPLAFGPLQATTAKVSGPDPILMGATNSSGGVMGKMISPQNLSVEAAGVGAVGREGETCRRVAGHNLLLTAMTGLLAMLQASALKWRAPDWGWPSRRATAGGRRGRPALAGVVSRRDLLFERLRMRHVPALIAQVRIRHSAGAKSSTRQTDSGPLGLCES